MAKKKKTKKKVKIFNKKTDVLNIKFLPGQQEAENEAGESLLETAAKAGIHLYADCGGAGTCGRCKVKVISGEYWRKDASKNPLPEDDGYERACLVMPESDMVVEIPETSLSPEIKQNLEYLDSIDISQIPYKFEPLVEKYYLEISPSSDLDDLSDLQSLYRELIRVTGTEEFVISYEALKILPNILRASDWKFTVTLNKVQKPVSVVFLEEGDTRYRHYGVVFDLGTTTIEALLVDINKKAIISKSSKMNPQVKYGSDLLSRMNYAREHRMVSDNVFQSFFALLLQDSLNETIKELIDGTGISHWEISSVFISANTVMTHFLLGLDTEPLRRQPHVPVTLSYPVLTADELRLYTAFYAQVFISPGTGSYVGGDMVSSLVATGMPKGNFMLVDIGTNSEASFVLDGNIICAATSAGPAFEGGGIKNGMRAASGAINRVNYNPELNDFEFSTIDNTEPVGICGTGLIDLLASLFLTGLVDKKGKLRNKPGHLRIKSNNGVDEFVIRRDSVRKALSVTDRDIDYLVKSKGALYAGTDFLAKTAGKSFDEIDRYYIAGALGGFINIESGVIIGLFPDIAREKFEFLGNASLTGGLMQILSLEARNKALEIAENSAYIELSNEPAYMNDYTSTLFLPHTELEKFPSIMNRLNKSE
jgi:uncharacterized 2Fe-2S/4Fe-4S cluster protein (DUF4445 family)